MADSMRLILSFPPDVTTTAKEYDRKACEYTIALSRLSQATWTRPTNKQDLLDLLDPATHSIAFLKALLARIANTKSDVTSDEIIDRVAIFLRMFDPVQMRYVSGQWRSLVDWAFDAFAALSDFTPIVAAMLRLDPTAGTFMHIHLRLVRQCLACGVPSQALPVLDKDIYAFPQRQVRGVSEEIISGRHDMSNGYITVESSFSSPIMSEHVLEYYLLGAHIYTGLRKYSRARLFLEYVILTPTFYHACSAFQVEAYKKWVMIGLLSEGKRFPLPHTHDQQVMKSIRVLSRPYEALAEDFERRDFLKYQAEIDVGKHIWYDDGNARLVGEAKAALLRFRVLDLQKIYAVLPMNRVASHMGLELDHTVQILTDLIRTAYVNATIVPSNTNNPGDAILCFHFAAFSTVHSSLEEAELEAQAKRIESLSLFIRDADRRIQLTKEYVEYRSRVKRSPEGDLADQMDLTWDASHADIREAENEEEDIMSS